MTTIDGKEREFLLTMGGLRRFKQRMGVDRIEAVLGADAEATAVPLLFEALRDKGELTEETFADILPAHLELIMRTIAKLIGASFPEDRPTDAEPTPANQ